MAATDAPPIGLSHPTVDPRPDDAAPTTGRAEGCECNDCDFSVDIDDGLPPKCPVCDGALTRVTS